MIIYNIILIIQNCILVLAFLPTLYVWGIIVYYYIYPKKRLTIYIKKIK